MPTLPRSDDMAESDSWKAECKLYAAESAVPATGTEHPLMQMSGIFGDVEIHGENETYPRIVRLGQVVQASELSTRWSSR